MLNHSGRPSVRHRYVWSTVLACMVAAVALAASAAEPAADTGDRPFTHVRTLKTGFEHAARGIAVTPEGRIYAAGDRAVHIIGPGGDHVSFPLRGDPSCIAIGTNGLLYIGMGDRVDVVDHCGTPRAQWEPPASNSVITAIAAGRASVWVADAGRREILRYSLAGAIEARWGGRTGDTNSLVVPSPHLDVAEDAQGRVWVANPGRHRLQIHNPDGALLGTWGFFSHEDPAGFTGCCNPADFACAPDGTVVTADKGALARVRVFDAGGRLLATVADPGKLNARDLACLAAGLDVATDARGRIYVLEPVARTVLVFARKEK